MSIIPGTPENENVTTSAVMGWLFRLNMMLIPFGSVCMFWLVVWLVMGHFSHDTRIAVLEARSASNGRDGVSQSVNVGQAAKMAQSGKTYLTVADVAEREGVATRTITEWISENRVMPLPVKGTKGFEIALDYRILPQSAACCGDEVPAATAQVRAKTQDLQTQDARPETPTPQ
jgi:hypothetical protein